MKNSISLKSVLLLVGAVAALSGCGGGDGAPTNASTVGADASDKYVGTWDQGLCQAGAPTAGNSFFRQTISITKISTNVYSSSGGIYGYPTSACSGTGALVPGDSASTIQTIVGTKTIGSTEVDKVTYPNGTGTTKSVAYVNLGGPALQVGDLNSVRDAEGFPTALEAARYAKR